MSIEKSFHGYEVFLGVLYVSILDPKLPPQRRHEPSSVVVVVYIPDCRFVRIDWMPKLPQLQITDSFLPHSIQYLLNLLGVPIHVCFETGSTCHHGRGMNQVLIAQALFLREERKACVDPADVAMSHEQASQRRHHHHTVRWIFELDSFRELAHAVVELFGEAFQAVHNKFLESVS